MLREACSGGVNNLMQPRPNPCIDHHTFRRGITDELRVTFCVPVVSLAALVLEFVATVINIVARINRSYVWLPVFTDSALFIGSIFTWNAFTPSRSTYVVEPWIARSSWLGASYMYVVSVPVLSYIEMPVSVTI